MTSKNRKTDNIIIESEMDNLIIDDKTDNIIVKNDEYLLTISNRSHPIYEIEDIVQKREQFYIINNLDTVIEIANKRYFSRDDNVIVIKIVKIDTGDRLTIEIVLDSFNNGIYFKRSNPNKDIVYNSFNNAYSEKITKNLLPLTKEKLLTYNLVKLFFKF